MADIIVFGSIVQDLVSYTETFPRPGESVRGISFEAGSGGKGANQASQAARLGAKVLMIARVGNDVFGPLNIEGLRKVGVITDYVEKSDTCGTATATITVSNQGENSIVVTLGANNELSAARAEELEKVIASAKILLCQFEITVEALQKALEVAKRNCVCTFFNFAPGVPNFDKRILRFVDILCTNENETEFLTNMKVDCPENAARAAMSLLPYGPRAVIATLGARGAVVATKDGAVHVDVPPVKAVDTTGAGDSFCGALAYLMVKRPELSLEEQVRRASLIASISVQKKGTQNSYPWAKDLPEGLIN